MEVYKKTIKLGNSAGVVLPKHWLGYDVRVIVVNRPRNIKKEALSILEPLIENITGIYLAGSYARKEQNSLSDINLIAVSSGLEKHIIKSKYNISIIPFIKLIKILPKNIPLYMMIKESIAILNKAMIEEIKKINLDKEAVQKYSENIRKSIAGLKLEEEIGNDKLLLVLKEIYILNCILNNKDYSIKNMQFYLAQLNNQESRKLLFLYNSARKNTKIKVSQKEALHLLSLLSSLLDSTSRFSKP